MHVGDFVETTYIQNLPQHEGLSKGSAQRSSAHAILKGDSS